MIINQDHNTSSSLQIVQPQNRMTFTNNDSSQMDLTYDKQLSYSKDQPSFSFHIQDQNRSSIRQSYGFMVLNNQPPKRNRREIFDKYKFQPQPKQQQQENSKKISLNTEGENDIMKAFDQIFSISTPRNISGQYRQPISPSSPKNIFNRKSYTDPIYNQNHNQDQKHLINQFHIMNTPEKINNVNIVGKEANKINTPSPNKIFAGPQSSSQPQLFRSQQFFKTPLDLSMERSNKPATETQNVNYQKNLKQNQYQKGRSLQNQNQVVEQRKIQQVYLLSPNQIVNLSDIQNRISVIYGENHNSDYSRDSSDLNQILKAEIFQDKQRVESTRIPQSFQINQKVNVVKSQIRETNNQFRQQNIQARRVVPSVYQQKQFNTVSLIKKTNQSNNIYNASPIQLQKINTNSEEHIKPVTIQYNNEGGQQQQKMQLSRFSDVYQRIDMSQSIANSVVFKESRAKIFDNNRNFLGAGLERNGSLGNLGSLKNFNKSGSSGFLGLNQQNTLINGLSSFKSIQQPSQQSSIPKFMRKTAKLNSLIPNFMLPQSIEEGNRKLQQLVASFGEVVKFLEVMLLKIKQKEQKRKQTTQLFSTGITVQKFKTCGWQVCADLQNLDSIKPKQNINSYRQWKSSKVQQALLNYRSIVQSHEGIKINLKDQRGIQKYLEIRKKYWSIQKNILMIVQDMYIQMMCLSYPPHFIQFKEILQDDEIIFDSEQIKDKKRLLQKIKKLRDKNQQLSSSQVGTLVMQKITKQIKFNSTNY